MKSELSQHLFFHFEMIERYGLTVVATAFVALEKEFVFVLRIVGSELFDGFSADYHIAFSRCFFGLVDRNDAVVQIEIDGKRMHTVGSEEGRTVGVELAFGNDFLDALCNVFVALRIEHGGLVETVECEEDTEDNGDDAVGKEWGFFRNRLGILVPVSPEIHSSEQGEKNDDDVHKS